MRTKISLSYTIFEVMGIISATLIKMFIKRGSALTVQFILYFSDFILHFVFVYITTTDISLTETLLLFKETVKCPEIFLGLHLP